MVQVNNKVYLEVVQSPLIIASKLERLKEELESEKLNIEKCLKILKDVRESLAETRIKFLKGIEEDYT